MARVKTAEETIREELRIERAEEDKVIVSVTVQAGHPINWLGVIRYPGQTFSMPQRRAEPLVAQGRVVINP